MEKEDGKEIKYSEVANKGLGRKKKTIDYGISKKQFYAILDKASQPIDKKGELTKEQD